MPRSPNRGGPKWRGEPHGDQIVPALLKAFSLGALFASLALVPLITVGAFTYTRSTQEEGLPALEAPSASPLPAVAASPTPSPSPSATPAPTATLIPARYEPADCEFEVPADHHVECGFLTVPENRRQADGRTIQLHIAIIRSRSEDPAPDPVVFLHGGPGAGALDILSVFLSSFQEVLADRDLIVLDQRGVGHSRPALSCPELAEASSENQPQDLTQEDFVRLQIERNLACHDRLLAEGIDLTAYSSAESAADLNDLRLALGYEKWNLFGVSYGSRLALTVMRDFSEGLRSVILDSAYPLQVNLFTDWAINAQRAIDFLFTSCSAQAGCSRAYPQLDAEFYELMERLSSDPVQLNLPSAGTDMLVTGQVITDLITKMLNSPNGIRWAPRLISDAHAGDFELLSMMLAASVGGDQTTRGANLSVQCGEEVRFGSLDLSLELSADMHPGMREHFDMASRVVFETCEGWKVGEVSPIENLPVVSDIPTLVMMGEFDPYTPPDWGWLATETLANSRLLMFPGAGHWVALSDLCAATASAAFLRSPAEMAPPECYSSLQTPDFAAP